MDTDYSEKAEEQLMIEREISRFSLGEESPEVLKDQVVVEDRAELHVNGEHYVTFSCSPSNIREMAVGHLLAEGIIEKPEEIECLKISKGGAYVQLGGTRKLWRPDKPRALLTCCGDGALKIPPRLLMNTRRAKIGTALTLKPQIVFDAAASLNTQAHIFRKTGGTHAAALLDEEAHVIAFSEDIGRHNAVDKVIGEAALRDVDLGKTLLASTGRLTAEMALKAAFAGIPVIISISAPTDKGIKVADACGLTLIGFVRGKQFNIYAHPERVVMP